MNEATVIQLAQRTLQVIIYVSAPMLGLSLIVGIAVSIFQATTQIQEQTMTFIPKILAVMAAIALFGSWILTVLIEYTKDLYMHIGDFIR